MRMTAKQYQALASNPVEYQEAKNFADWLYTMRLTGKIVEYAHLINELSMNRKGGQSANFAYLNKRKAEGWRQGVPDYLIVTKDKTIFVELKRCKGNSATPEQKQWIEAINKAGGYAAVAKGAQEAIRYVESLL